MKAKIVVVGDEPLVSGLSLAGLEYCFVADSSNYESLLSTVLEDPEIGVLFTNESLYKSLSWRMKKRLEESAYPVVVPLPDIATESTEGEELRKLIKKALGFDLSG